MHVTLKEALLGFKKRILHLDGHFVEVEKTSVTHPDQKQKFKGEGMPKHNFPSEKGNLIVTFKIDFPKKISEEAKAAIEKVL